MFIHEKGMKRFIHASFKQKSRMSILPEESKVPPLFFSIYFDFQKLLGQKKQFFEWVWVIACLACMFSVNLGVQILPKFQNFSEFFPYNNEHYTFLA